MILFLHCVDEKPRTLRAGRNYKLLPALLQTVHRTVCLTRRAHTSLAKYSGLYFAILCIKVFRSYRQSLPKFLSTRGHFKTVRKVIYWFIVTTSPQRKTHGVITVSLSLFIKFLLWRNHHI